ncbi:DUF481 domain-containing protein [Stieleria sp. TO1_6]|uniref:DUF481 domain-containing protein n=1 Tax=Stieleria tagensis TaxID=2956795 RepID=UPI00209AB7F7|nr:DUF481 domain-containing protein [Stieleria tagensis]MCO8125110.1 DUF481 domain-containing protein [Stieleria tagensis]
METRHACKRQIRPDRLVVVRWILVAALFCAVGVTAAQDSAEITTAAQQPADKAAGLSLWERGILTFSPSKETDQAADLPTYQFPFPAENAVSSDVTSNPDVTVAASETPVENEFDGAVQPVDYQINPLTIESGPRLAGPQNGLPGTPSADLSLPIPDLPNANVPMIESLPLPTAPGAVIGNGVAPEGAATTIGEAIAAGENGEELPLEEETAAWYQIPWLWITRGWKNHAELGMDGASGNSRTLAFQTGLEMKRKTDLYTFALDFDYRKATNNKITTEDNGRLNLDYDRLLHESNWSAFAKFGAEWDQFKAFDLRLNLNSGLGYYWLRDEETTFVTRFGAGASQEIGAPDDDWKAEAVFGTEFERQLNRYHKLKAKVDYFPAWEDFSDFRMVSDIAWEILLDDTENLSLKLGLTDRYDSTPQGAKPNDVYYSLLLLVKF